MVVERDETSGVTTLHIRGCKLRLTQAEAERLMRFLFVTIHRPQDAARPVSLGYDRRGQAVLF